MIWLIVNFALGRDSVIFVEYYCNVPGYSAKAAFPCEILPKLSKREIKIQRVKDFSQWPRIIRGWPQFFLLILKG